MLQASLQLYRNAYGGIPKKVWWLALVMLVNRSGTMVIPFLTVYLTSQGYSLAEAGFMMALFGTGAIFGGYIGGRLTDKFGFFYVQIISLLLNGVLFITLGYMQHLWQIGVCIFMLSCLGEAFRPANASAVVAYSHDYNRTRSYSLIRLATNLGWAIGPAMGGVLASISYDYLFWVDGLTCISASALLYFLLFSDHKSTAAKEESAMLHPLKSAYRDTIYLKGLFFILLISICFFQMFSVLPVFYKEVVHMPEATIGWVLSINGLIIAFVEMILIYKIENKRDGMYYMRIGALLIGSAFLILTVAPTYSVVLISMLTITFGEMFLFPFTNIFWVTQSIGGGRGQYAALYTMTFALAQVLAPTFASQIAERAGFTTLFITDFLLCVAAMIGFYFLRKNIITHE